MLKRADILRHKLIGILNEENSKESLILDELRKQYRELPKVEKNFFYSELLFLLTHLEFSEEEAKEHWNKILDRFYELKEMLKREISLRMSVIDYFTTDYKLLKNPIIIEIFLYEVTEKKAMLDELTGLYNFRYLQKALESEFKRSLRHNLQFSVVFMDLDNLKSINDSHGHTSGDQTLQEIGKLLRLYKRTEDIACRYGGDEFVCLLPQTNKEGALHCVNRIMKKMEENFRHSPYPVTLSAGVASFPDDGDNTELILDRADKALYNAKISGKNRVICY